MTTRLSEGEGVSPIASRRERALFRLYAAGVPPGEEESTARHDVHPRTLPWALLPTLAQHPGFPQASPPRAAPLGRTQAEQLLVQQAEGVARAAGPWGRLGLASRVAAPRA